MFNVLFLFTDQMLSHLIFIGVTLFYVLHYVSLCDSHLTASLPSATTVCQYCNYQDDSYICTKTYIHPLKRPDVENK